MISTTVTDGRCPTCNAPLDLYLYPDSLALRKCSSCGKMIPRAANYCPFCDVEVDDSDLATEPGSETATKPDNGPKAAVITGIVLSVIIIAFTVFFLIGINNIDHSSTVSKEYSSAPVADELASISYLGITFDDIAGSSLELGDYVEITGVYLNDCGSVFLYPEDSTFENRNLRVSVYAHDGGVKEALQDLKDTARDGDVVTVRGIIKQVYHGSSIMIMLYSADIEE